MPYPPDRKPQISGTEEEIDTLSMNEKPSHLEQMRYIKDLPAGTKLPDKH